MHPQAELRRRARDDAEENGARTTAASASAAVSVPGKWVRPVVRAVSPVVDGGRRPAKGTVGELVAVAADAFVDGHDPLWCELRHRHESATTWTVTPLTKSYDDRWHGVLPVEELGLYRFWVRATVDEFAGWRDDLRARADAGQDIAVHLETGALLLEELMTRFRSSERALVARLAEALRRSRRGLESEAPTELAAQWLDDAGPPGPTSLGDVLFSPSLAALLGPVAAPSSAANAGPFALLAEPARARFSAWYEMFPRSAGTDAGHGTFADVGRRLDYVERMGFDVLYLPPIHPIGHTARKGRNAATKAEPDDVGSPWAIGAAEGGHTAVHPDLGTVDDFRELVREAGDRGIDVAIDLAFQASPDHPWVREHPTWFRHAPDGTIRYAENPPKRYEDIYPFDFESPDWPDLWRALLDVVRFWVAQGVRIFRVDNPHTKPFAFWEWLLASIRAEAPSTIFLSEAFTRPRVMEHLARVGFTQSYTYFTWRSSKWELETYAESLTRSETSHYLRPNLWPNTPDILTDELQEGGRSAFLARLVLAATLAASYGIYGPAFELQEHVPREPGSEEYLRSEKYEIRSWDLDSPTTLAPFIALVNRIRQEHVALQFNDSLRFHGTDNDALIAYSKVREAGAGRDVVLTVVNLDHDHAQSGWLQLDLDALGLDPDEPFVAHDLLSDARYAWRGSVNFVKLDPADVPCHIFSLTQRMPTGGPLRQTGRGAP